jgi:hypothetical protein
MTNAQDASPQAESPRYKRKMRNYLLDVGLQILYTAFIIGVAVFLTAVLGYQIYEATLDTSKLISMTVTMGGLLDAASAKELQDHFRANDRLVLLGIAGFGVLLVGSIFAVGIWMTHKVAGPLYTIASLCTRVRDNNLAPPLRSLRKGDELQAFHASFREMYEALRTRAQEDVRVLNNAIASIEAAPPGSPQLRDTLTELAELRRQKEKSLEPADGLAAEKRET